MSSTAFTSEIYEVSDALEANELYQRNGWTDGLPIVAPTEAAVSRFLAVAKLDAACVIGTEPVRRRAITAEKVAIAAGGPAGGFGAILPPWYGNKSLAVTEPIAG